MSKHLHREQEEVYLVLDGTAMIDVDQGQFRAYPGRDVSTGASVRADRAG
ncbi:MAG: hypothetical protein WCP98_15630 [Actinomycetes bacterium]